ncbi:MAG TPA: class I SAM-dependent methyltransferase [Verrucomicrobiae bacterium]|nr:class I SAM-dependent methyltransferase [Verrucomicrobiae bacterium]
MQEGRFSRTAHGVAVRRAAHQIFDDPKVLDDPIALSMVSPESVEELRSNPQKQQEKITRAFRAFMAARSRYAEDQLHRAFAEGVRQYVVLGAGLDTFAYRNPHAELRVFEVDHPATQNWKRQRLQASTIAIPPSVTFVPVDFERQTLAQGLERSQFDLSASAFFSWLGVTPYLTREACMATLAFAAKRAAGSGIAFDFAVHRDLLNLREKLALYALSQRVAAAGEPFQLFFRPDELAADLRVLGFRQTEILAAAEINARYFTNRSDGLKIIGGAGRLACAWV